VETYKLNRNVLVRLAGDACETLMKKYTPEELPPRGHFHYHQGVFLSGMHETFRLTGDGKLLEYIKAWVDSLIDSCGNIISFNPGQLDDLQPGILLFPLYQQSKDGRYAAAMDTIAHYLEHFPRTPEGGFWHKAWHRNEMWLDGLYLAGPFMAEYGKVFSKPAFFDLVVFQADMMRQVTMDPNTGLWRHAWDRDRRHEWADPVTGRSPEFWGRSMGWVVVALLNDLDFLPEEHPGRAALQDMARGLLTALCRYQDGETGLWYQVVDKPGQPGNWVETSCTCLYAAALCKAVRKGLMEDRFLLPAREAIRGVISRLKHEENGILLDNVCIGTGIGDYDFYCARPTSVNDLHGVGAFLLMLTEAARIPGRQFI